MALWYKAWLESRVRFLTSAAVLVAYCASFVEQARINFPPVFEPHISYSLFLWRGVYNGIDTLLFVAVALLLGLGGLRREGANGTAGFTLALPVTRLELLRSRAAVAMIEVAALAVIPALVVPWLSARIGHPYPMTHAMRFAFLFGATGAVWAAAGIFWSTLVVAEPTGAVACLATPVVYAVVVAGTPLRRWPGANIFYVMNGAHLSFLDPATALFTGQFPWQAVAGPVGVAALLLAASGMVVRRTDF